jgi:hypothetical protein
MSISDHFSESLETVLGLKIFKFFDVDPDPGSGFFLTLDLRWNILDPGLSSRIRNTQKNKFKKDIERI